MEAPNANFGSGHPILWLWLILFWINQLRKVHRDAATDANSKSSKVIVALEDDDDGC